MVRSANGARGKCKVLTFLSEFNIQWGDRQLKLEINGKAAEAKDKWKVLTFSVREFNIKW